MAGKFVERNDAGSTRVTVEFGDLYGPLLEHCDKRKFRSLAECVRALCRETIEKFAQSSTK